MTSRRPGLETREGTLGARAHEARAHEAKASETEAE